jgi:hypothetical protein
MPLRQTMMDCDYQQLPVQQYGRSRHAARAGTLRNALAWYDSPVDLCKEHAE